MIMMKRVSTVLCNREEVTYTIDNDDNNSSTHYYLYNSNSIEM